MTCHVIRLRGPWEYRVLASLSPPTGGGRQVETSVPPSGRLTMPADWGATLGADFCGRVAYHRRFGRPTGLGPADRVELAIDRVDALGSVRLNGESLGEIPAGGQPWRCDVTARLRRRNELIVEVELPHVPHGTPPVSRSGREDLSGGLTGEVWLEISSVG